MARVNAVCLCVQDDYGNVPECKKAIGQFFELHDMDTEVVVDIDGYGAYWRKATDFRLNVQWYRDFNTSRGSEA